MTPGRRVADKQVYQALLAAARSANLQYDRTASPLVRRVHGWFQPFPLLPDADPQWPAGWQALYRRRAFLRLIQALEAQPPSSTPYGRLLHACAAFALHDLDTVVHLLEPWEGPTALGWYAHWYTALAWTGLHEHDAARSALARMRPAPTDPRSAWHPHGFTAQVQIDRETLRAFLHAS
ncbi:MAG: hypothetical protein AAF570_16300 [Bacteroidota bacterium]